MMPVFDQHGLTAAWFGLLLTFTVCLNAPSEAQYWHAAYDLSITFQIISEITQIETIAAGSSVRERAQLVQRYGPWPMAQNERRGDGQTR